MLNKKLSLKEKENMIYLTIEGNCISIPKKEFEQKVKYELIGLGHVLLKNTIDK